MDDLIELDKKLLIYLNSLHTNWLDPVMMLFTQTLFWLPLYALLLFIMIRTYGKTSWIPLLGIALTIFLADRITSGLMKPYFARFRPSQEPSLKGLIHLVHGYTGGLYGFASSHAANTLGTATFFWLLLRDRHKWIVLLFPWALIMTYTRIYLGVHYPGDILVGGLIGIASGWAGYKLFHALQRWYLQRNTGAALKKGLGD
jgi:undecaprenyl-diphosphatase